MLKIPVFSNIVLSFATHTTNIHNITNTVFSNMIIKKLYIEMNKFIFQGTLNSFFLMLFIANVINN